MVFYKRAYGSAQEAQLKGDGLAVLAFFYEVSRALQGQDGTEWNAMCKLFNNSWTACPI